MSRGSGAAAALIEEAEDRMRNAGIQTAWLAHERDDSGGLVFEVWRHEKLLRAGPGADRH